MATQKKAARKTAVKKRSPWTTSEILYAVLGYLTTRKKELILSGHHDAAPVAEILAAIIEANGLPKPRNRYPKIQIPDKAETLTNVPTGDGEAVRNDERRKLPAAGEMVETVFNQLQTSMDLSEQNKFVAELLARMAASRREFVDLKEKNRNAAIDEVDRARKIHEDFMAVVKNS